MWLVYREQTNGRIVMHARNGRECRTPELSRLNVDGFCAEIRTVYEFFDCLFHGHICLPFRDVTNLGVDILTERYEQIMARLERVTSAGYTVELVWESPFDKDILPHNRELKQHLIV